MTVERKCLGKISPLSLERLSVLADGRVVYRIKNPRGYQTHRLRQSVNADVALSPRLLDRRRRD